ARTRHPIDGSGSRGRVGEEVVPQEAARRTYSSEQRRPPEQGGPRAGKATCGLLQCASAVEDGGAARGDIGGPIESQQTGEKISTDLDVRIEKHDHVRVSDAADANVAGCSESDVLLQGHQLCPWSMLTHAIDRSVT